jgi:hypothetical protein
LEKLLRKYGKTNYPSKEALTVFSKPFGNQANAGNQ